MPNDFQKWYDYFIKQPESYSPTDTSKAWVGKTYNNAFGHKQNIGRALRNTESTIEVEFDHSITPKGWHKLGFSRDISDSERKIYIDWLSENIGPRKHCWAVLRDFVMFKNPEDATTFKMIVGGCSPKDFI